MTAECVGAAIDAGMKALDHIFGYTFENEAMIALADDWEGRDSRARVERTYNRGRFSHVRRTLGIVSGRWYCCLKTEAALAKGIELDY